MTSAALVELDGSPELFVLDRGFLALRDMADIGLPDRGFLY